MKYSKAVYVTAHDIEGHLNREYDVYASKIAKNEIHYLSYENKDFACQYDSNRETLICTCKRVKREGNRYFNTSRQIYRSQRYTAAKGYTDIGVGNVKTAPKKRVRRVYLPDTQDRGVGSSDFTSFTRRERHDTFSYYERKKTSSKCVGGGIEYRNISTLNAKLSPICKTKSGSTSPNRNSYEEKHNTKNHYIIPDPVVNLIVEKKYVKGDKIIREQGTTIIYKPEAHADKRNVLAFPNVASTNEEKDFSSDSLVQQVHNLENPSSFKQSKTYFDAMNNNKSEREYIKIFSEVSKQGKPIAEIRPVRDSTSASLRRRFEALRRSLVKKEESAEHSFVIKSSSQISNLSRKDVSVTSDPPSLEARSYTNAKICSPIPSPVYKYGDVPQTPRKKSVTGKKRSSHWSTDVIDSDCQNVKGMFKLWGKKFDFEEDSYKKTTPYTTQEVTTKQKKKVELILPKEEVLEKQKKEVKKFSLFKRRTKEKAKSTYKSKKGVTAGRCEVGDGLTIRIGAANDITPEPVKIKSEQILDDCEDILKKAWLKRCLDNKNDSRNSVKIRWNNEMYATSSSTVFELMECLYKNTGILFTSRSEMTTSTVPTTTTVEIPCYHANNQAVNFMQQTIQAWMIPKMTTDKSMDIQKPKKKDNIEVSFSNQKWFIDKSKAVSQKIELVLHSKNFVKNNAAKSSEYIVIDIPKGYFLETSSEDEQCQSSDEQVYNIVEYETAKSTSYLNKKRIDRKMETGDHLNNVRVTVNVNENVEKGTNVLEKEINTSLLHRDVVVQGSNVYLPKRCDVISVGIITQHTHNREIQKPILRLQDEITDDESMHTIPKQKKCELAESYLQDYYRHWVPLDIDLYSWCISDSNLRASSDNNSFTSFNNQGDGSKSCPNIYDDYQTSALVSPCTSSSKSQCIIIKETKIDDTTTTYFNKLKKNPDEPQQAQGEADGKRVLPKDSLEVFKRRKFYADSKVKADWCENQGLEPLSKPSILDKFAQKLSNESLSWIKNLGNKSKKNVKKHVSLKEFKRVGGSILSVKGSSGCKICKKKGACSKHALVIPEPLCEMISPPCLSSCIKKKIPPCKKKDSPTCLVPPPPVCPVGPPNPCQPACPPIPPPCAPHGEGNYPSPATLPPSSPSRFSISKFLPGRKKCSPPNPQQNPLSPSNSQTTSNTHLPSPAPPPTKPRSFSRLLSRYTKQKSSCKESCTKQKKPPCSIKGPSPCASSTEGPTSPPRSPRNSPAKSPQTSHADRLPTAKPNAKPTIEPNSKPRLFCKFFSSLSKQRVSCKDSCSKLKEPPCSTKGSSPCTSLSEMSPPLPRSSSPDSPNRKKLQKKKSPCEDSCSKLKKPPCSTKDSSPCSSLPDVKFPSFHRIHRTKFSSPNSQKKSLGLESDVKENTPAKELPKVQCGCFPRLETEPPSDANTKKLCGVPLCLGCKKSSSQECTNQRKNRLSPNNSHSLENSSSMTYAEVFKRYTSNSSSLTTKKESGDCDRNFSNNTEVKKQKECATSIPQIPLPELCQPTSPKPRSQSKMSGVHLRKLPMPRNSSSESKPFCEVIKLNSKENLTIRTKPKTPSTEEIREGCNIKVQDEDGQTLYERREYKIDTAQARKHLVQDMYRDSQIHRVSTSKADIVNEKKIEFSDRRSNTSLSNIVEINLNLKFKQADKTTDSNIKECGSTTQNRQNDKLNCQACNNVFSLQDNSLDKNKSVGQIEDAEKRDVNIKIVINNYKQNSNKAKQKIKHPNLKAGEDFSKKISEKFHTVSTGYSDVLDGQTYSIHRATVNFTDSADISKDFIKCSKELLNEDLLERKALNLTDAECITKSKSEPCVTLVSSYHNGKVDSQALPSNIKLSNNLENSVDIYDEKSATGISTTDNEDYTSDVKIPKIRNKEEKKKILKRIFEKSVNNKNDPNKSKIRHIRNMLRAVLTSDSSGYEDDSLNHELAKQLAYESLKPNFFKNSESMTNYYKTDSSISDNRSCINEIEEILHPTEINNSLEDTAESTNENSRCLCSLLAAKLNICETKNFNACSCRGNVKRDEEIDCNIFKDIKENTANYIDVETQNSNWKGQLKKIAIAIGSSEVVIQPQEENYTKRCKLFNNPKKVLSYSSSIKVCKLHTPAVGLYNDDAVLISNLEKPQKDAPVNNKTLNPIDVLQLYETKKAVLEIYAEKTIFNNTEEHVVAKLPKFICDTENEFCNYDAVYNSGEISAHMSL